MEFIKPKENLIIDKNYIPSTELNYMDYFNRAMAFAQTNYHSHLMKLIKVSFRKMIPTAFFEEYTAIILQYNSGFFFEKEKFNSLSESLAPLYRGCYDNNSFPKKEDVIDNIAQSINSQEIAESLYKCANILSRGIKLFGWDNYKHRYLGSVEKLTVLPEINLIKAKKLARNIGLYCHTIDDDRVEKLAKHWGFSCSESLCKEISKHVPMQLKIIELILWYGAVHFDDADEMLDIVNAD